MSVVNPQSIKEAVDKLEKERGNIRISNDTNISTYLELVLIPKLKTNKDATVEVNMSYSIAFANYLNMSNLPENEIVEKITNTLIKKNSDYGNSFEEGHQFLGNSNIIVPLYNKMKRLNSLEDKNFESKEDTVLDIMGYLILYFICITNIKEN